MEESAAAFDDAGGGGNGTAASAGNLTGCMRMPGTPHIWSTIFEGILSVIVGVCGLLGNCASIVVLTRPNFKETFHKLLVCLSVFDSLFVGRSVNRYQYNLLFGRYSRILYVALLRLATILLACPVDSHCPTVLLVTRSVCDT